MVPFSRPKRKFRVNHFRMVSRVGNERDSEEQTFILPF